MSSRGRFEAADSHCVTVPLQRTATPPPAFTSPLPPASGFENNEDDLGIVHVLTLFSARFSIGFELGFNSVLNKVFNRAFKRVFNKVFTRFFTREVFQQNFQKKKKSQQGWAN